ncbi:MAG: hypothetical protein WC188_03755 [Candidatus Caldatribacteriota bacterium]
MLKEMNFIFEVDKDTLAKLAIAAVAGLAATAAYKKYKSNKLLKKYYTPAKSNKKIKHDLDTYASAALDVLHSDNLQSLKR